MHAWSHNLQFYNCGPDVFVLLIRLKMSLLGMSRRGADKLGDSGARKRAARPRQQRQLATAAAGATAAVVRWCAVWWCGGVPATNTQLRKSRIDVRLEPAQGHTIGRHDHSVLIYPCLEFAWHFWQLFLRIASIIAHQLWRSNTALVLGVATVAGAAARELPSRTSLVCCVLSINRPRPRTRTQFHTNLSKMFKVQQHLE